MSPIIQYGRTVAVIFALGFFAMTPSPVAAQQATQVGTDDVLLRSINQTLPVSGRFVALQGGAVAARINAPVADIHIKVGDTVQQGQDLISLVNERLTLQQRLSQAELTRAQAALKTAQAELDIVSQELKRLQRLQKSAAFSQANFDDKKLEQIKADSAVNEARAAVETARADLALVKLDITYATIKAPYDGVVTQRHVEKGTYVSLGQDVITLIAPSSLEIEADVPTDRLAGLIPNTAVTIHLAGHDQTLDAHVRALVPEENPLTRTRAVRFRLGKNYPLERLASNQTLTLDIPIGDKTPILSVAKDAVIAKNGGHMVFKIVEGKAQPTAIRIGVSLGNYFAVKEGLSEGDVVVTRGNERLRPNQAVQALGS